MKIYSVHDEEFKTYGRIIEGIPCGELMDAMKKIAFENDGVSYEPYIESLEACKEFKEYESSVFGGMPVQLGMCWGHNTKLNCLEYHRDSEFNLGTDDFILLLAKQSEIQNYMLDTSKVKAFRVPAGELVEVYATSLHYAPCHTDANKGFHVLVALPRGTNTQKPELSFLSEEDRYLTARNKWLLAHADSNEAKSGAVIGLSGINIDIQNDI